MPAERKLHLTDDGPGAGPGDAATRDPDGSAAYFASSGVPPPLERVLSRLDRLIDWERRERASAEGGGMRVDVEPARALLDELGSPHRGLRVVHVAGSKGKGSVCALVERALLRAGVRTGCYTSPHVERITERVRIDGEEVDGLELAAALEAALAARDRSAARGGAGRAATWFDVLTAAALEVFRRAGVTWAVVECGLGGRLDSTNALDGEVCVVTNVELEHTAILGDTRAAIAAEKVGILGRGATLATSLPRPPAPGPGGGAVPDEASLVVERRARELGATVLWPAAAADAGSDLDARNAALAGCVLDELGRRGVRASDARPAGAWLLDRETRRAARLPGRLELRDHGGVPVLLDGAHVPSSLEAVLDAAARRWGLTGGLVAVLGMGRDKDAVGLLKVLGGRVDRVICTSVGAGPVRSAGEIQRLAEAAGAAAETAVPPRVAFRRALETRRTGGWILVTGSLHLVGSIRPLLATAPEDLRC